MLYLLLAVGSSALVSIVMRLSSDRVKGNVSMLAVNYLMCLVIAALDADGQFFPAQSGLGQTLFMGCIHGMLYLGSFLLLQYSVKKNGVVLSATFMKLGLLVPMTVSVLFFKELPAPMQVVGFALAVAAILLINLEKKGGADQEKAAGQYRAILLLLLLGGGGGDVMSKIFEELGEASLSAQFLLYTFLTAFVLCLALMLLKKERPGKNELLFGLLIGIPNFGSAKFLLASLRSVPAVIAYPTYSVATILVVTLAGVCFFKEKLSKRQWIALAVILAALILLNL